MSESIAFLEQTRQHPATEAVTARTQHFREYEQTLTAPDAAAESKRCMQCSVPFCHGACPTNNLIAEFTEQVSIGQMEAAWHVLSETNPFPEITGRVCPAPCEQSCCLGAIRAPVSIKAIERSIGDWGLANGGLAPIVPRRERHQRVTVLGSGPCGMAAAVRLRQEGYKVQILERASLAGGLLRWGIPDYKLDKSIIDSRINWLIDSKVDIRTGVNVGKDISVEDLLRSCDALALAVGYEQERGLRTVGSDRPGVIRAMEFLKQQNLATLEQRDSSLSVKGKRVVVVGGGDTGWDCVGTAIRQGAQSVVRMTSRKRLPQKRPQDNPWPEPPQVQRTDSQTEECSEEIYDVRIVEIMGEDKVEAVRCERTLHRSEKHWNRKRESSTIEADCVIIAQGFEASGSEQLYDILGIAHSAGTLVTDHCRTNRPMIFAGGDAVVGPSLVVTAIRSGLEMAETIIQYFEAG
jgi:glutamate synthase (NADPH/NADH) small chain